MASTERLDMNSVNPAPDTEVITKLPGVRTVPMTAPFHWLARGFDDLRATGFRGLWYGMVFAAMGMIIATIYSTRWQLTMGSTASFFLMGPFICTGVYALSRQRARGEKADLVASWFSWKTNPKSIGFFAAMLTFFMIVWARVSIVVFALFSSRDFPTLQGVLAQVFTFDNLEFVGAWFGVGFIFASIVFAISVVSVPMMLDRGTDTMMAVFSSARALLTNPGPMYLWAALIVLLIGGSLVFGFFGLLLTAPIVGHATWHAYKDLIED